MSTDQTTKTKPISLQAKLVKKIQLTHDVIELHFESEPAFSFMGGQFVSIFVPGAGPGGRDLRRAYSIASEPEKPLFELCVKLVEGGPGTSYLNSLKIGDSMKGMAPYGDFIYKTKPNKDVVMIATGTGIAPFRSIIKSSLFKSQKPKSTRLLFGARKSEDLLYTEELQSELGGSCFIQTLSQEKQANHWHTGRVTDYLRQHSNLFDWKNTDFYLCGNGAMIDEIKKILIENAVEKTSIHQEVYYKPKADQQTG